MDEMNLEKFFLSLIDNEDEKIVLRELLEYSTNEDALSKIIDKLEKKKYEI